MCAIPEHLTGVITTRHYTNPGLPYLTLRQEDVTLNTMLGMSVYLGKSTTESINVNAMVDTNVSLYLGESTTETVNVVLTSPTVCAEFVSQRLQPLQSIHSVIIKNVSCILH